MGTSDRFIMNIRVMFNVFLVRLGIRQILPSDYINAIPVVENNEPLVKLHDDEDFVKTDRKFFVGRKAMIDCLLKAGKIVADKGYRLHIYQTYRSPEEQSDRRASLYQVLRKKYPSYDEKIIHQMINKRVAGVGGGHQTGCAVDLSLCDKGGKEVDMGTQYREHNLTCIFHNSCPSSTCLYV